MMMSFIQLVICWWSTSKYCAALLLLMFFVSVCSYYLIFLWISHQINYRNLSFYGERWISKSFFFILCTNSLMVVADALFMVVASIDGKDLLSSICQCIYAIPYTEPLKLFSIVYSAFILLLVALMLIIK